MNIAIVHFTAPPVPGGVENVMREHARLLSHAGHKVVVVAGRGRQLGDSKVRFQRIPLMAATHPAQRSIANQLMNGQVTTRFDEVSVELQSQLRPVLSKQDAVIVHNAFTLHFNLPLTAALCRLTEDKLHEHPVAWTHDIAAINPLYGKESHDGYPWDLTRKPQAGVKYVCISHQRRDELVALWATAGGRPPASAFPAPLVIPNGIDPYSALEMSGPVREMALRHRLMQREIVLLLPVRITRRKNIELAIDLTANLTGRGIDVGLVVTGPMRGHHPARSREYLEELIVRTRKLGVADRVLLAAAELGRPLPDSALAQLYRLCHVLFLPSRSEGFGLPILEAALNRLPIVASDLPAFREVASDNADYFGSNADLESIADLVLEAGGRGSRLRREIQARYAWDAIYERDIQPLLTSLCDESRNDG